MHIASEKIEGIELWACFEGFCWSAAQKIGPQK
jgi:hypothetical protein